MWSICCCYYRWRDRCAVFSCHFHVGRFLSRADIGDESVPVAMLVTWRSSSMVSRCCSFTVFHLLLLLLFLVGSSYCSFPSLSGRKVALPWWRWRWCCSSWGASVTRHLSMMSQRSFVTVFRSLSLLSSEELLCCRFPLLACRWCALSCWSLDCLILFLLKCCFGFPAVLCVVAAWIHDCIPLVVLCILCRIIVLLHIATALSIVSVLMLTFELIVVRGVDVISCMCVIRSLICVVVASWWHVASVLYTHRSKQ